VKFKMFSCKEISKVTCHEDELKGLEKLNYKMHLFMCVKCRKYVSNIKIIQERFSSLIKNRSVVDEAKIVELEDKILNTLKTKSENK
jgi:hypothetical protein